MTPTEARLQLRAQGYDCIPVRGKIPPMDAWQNQHNPNPETIEIWAKLYGDCENTGVLTHNASVVDTDILTPEAAEDLETLIKNKISERAPFRIGKNPKRAALFRCDTPFKKLSVEFISPGGIDRNERIEILASGQQLVAHGIHPETRQPYRWHNGSPFEIPRADLPLIDEATARDFLDAATELLAGYGYTVKRGGNGKGGAQSRDFIETEYTRVNDAALENLAAWVLVAFPNARHQPNTGAYRVSSAELGRALQEDLSLAPSGIRDFGTERGMTPLQVLTEFKGMSPWDASMWLCKRLDIDPAMLGFDVNPDIKDDPDDPQPEPDPQPPPGSTSDLPEIFWFGQENVEVDRRWLVDGLLPEAGVAIVAGQWGTYKTFSVLDLCAAIMAGESFIDYPILRKGGVLFIAGEGAEDLPIRIQAAVEARGLREAPFAWVRECPPLVDSKSTGFLITLAIAVNDEMLKRFGVPLVLIAFDTVGSLAGYKRGGDENDAAIHLAIVKRMRRAVERVPLLALGVDHFGKAPETGTRGSSAKEAGVDTVLALLGEKDISGKVTDSRMAVRKNRSGPQGREIAFSVKVVTVGTDDRGEPITTLTIEWKPGEGSAGPAAKAKADSWSKSLRLLRTILMDVLASDAASNQRPFADGPVVRAVDLGLVREEFGKRYPTEGDRDQRRKARSAAFQRAITGAQAKGLVGIRDIGTVTYVWLAVPESQSSTS